MHARVLRARACKPMIFAFFISLFFGVGTNDYFIPAPESERCISARAVDATIEPLSETSALCALHESAPSPASAFHLFGTRC